MKKTLVLLLCLLLLTVCGCKAEKTENTKSEISGTASSQTEGTESKAETVLDIVQLDGEYQDTNSKRATAKVEVTGNNSAIITVKWSNSAASTNVWTMTASLSSDGVLGYSNEKLVELITDENGTQTEKLIYQDKEGSFKVENGKLLWTGAYSENCRSCVFEKIK